MVAPADPEASAEPAPAAAREVLEESAPAPMTDFPASVRARALPVPRELTLPTALPGKPVPRMASRSTRAAAASHTQTLVLAVTAPPPGTVVAGAGFGMTISVENGQGQVDTSFDGPVTAVLSTNPNAATLGGTVTVDAHNGVAVFLRSDCQPGRQQLCDRGRERRSDFQCG